MRETSIRRLHTVPYDPMSLDAQSRCVCRDGEPVVTTWVGDGRGRQVLNLAMRKPLELAVLVAVCCVN